VGTYRPDLIMKVGRMQAATQTCPDSDKPFTVPYPCRHVRYHRRLRSRHRSPDCQRYGPSTGAELQFVYRIHASRGWTQCRSSRSRSGLRHWNRRRYGGEKLYATEQDLCRHGVDSHLRRSAGAIRVDRGTDPAFKELNNMSRDG
jgi:hypothetical protein